LRKEFQRIQENNKSAFENEKPLNLKRVNQPSTSSAAAAAVSGFQAPRKVSENAGIRIRQHEVTAVTNSNLPKSTNQAGARNSRQ
jgi:hypothetical protein